MNPKTAKRLDFIINTAYYAVIIGLLYLSYRYVLGWVLPFVVAFIIVSIVQPVIRRIKALLHIEREFVSLLIMLLIYLLFFLLLGALVAPLVSWLRALFSDLPMYYEETLRPAIEAAGASLSRFIADLPEPLPAQFDDLQSTILSAAHTLLMTLSQQGLALTTRVPTFFFALIFTVMLSFFISMQYERVTAYLLHLLPKRARGSLRGVRGIMRKTVGQYLRALLTLMVITAVELFIGLLLLGKSNAAPIAVGIAAFDALPFFGTGAIMIPWIALELLQGNLTFGVGLAILYGIVTLVRNIIEPKIISDKLGINPIVSLVAIYLGFRTMGVLGMIFMPILVQIVFAMYHAGNLPLFHHIFSPGDKYEPSEKDLD